MTGFYSEKGIVCQNLIHEIRNKKIPCFHCSYGIFSPFWEQRKTAFLCPHLTAVWKARCRDQPPFARSYLLTEPERPNGFVEHAAVGRYSTNVQKITCPTIVPQGQTKVTQVWDCVLQCISNLKAASLAGWQQPEDTAVLTPYLYMRGEIEKACDIQTTQCIFLQYYIIVCWITELNTSGAPYVGMSLCVRACVCLRVRRMNGEWKRSRFGFCRVNAETRPALDKEPQRVFSLPSLFLSLTVMPAPPPPPYRSTHKDTCKQHTTKHTQQYMARGVISLCPIKILLQLTFHIPDN